MVLQVDPLLFIWTDGMLQRDEGGPVHGEPCSAQIQLLLQRLLTKSCTDAGHPSFIVSVCVCVAQESQSHKKNNASL